MSVWVMVGHRGQPHSPVPSHFWLTVLKPGLVFPRFEAGKKKKKKIAYCGKHLFTISLAVRYRI